MERLPTHSSSVVSVGYSESTLVLEVEFTHGGVYQYLDVPRWCYDALLQSESVGNFVNTQVKPVYRYVRQ